MKIIGIYAGRFQPAHRGHLGVYKQLKQISGQDTFIATTDKTPTPESPLNFGEKQQIWVRHGVSSNNVVKVKNTYAPEEIINKYTPESTAAVFALGGKDAERFGSRVGGDAETGKTVWLKEDGKTPGYFQPYAGNENTMDGLDKHGYVLIITDIKIDGKKVSGTKIREALGSHRYTSDQKKKFFQWAFGWYDPSLFQMIVDRFSEAYGATQAQPITPTKTNVKKTIRELVSEIIEEYITPQGDSSQQKINQTNPASDSRTTDTLNFKKNAVDAKRRAERDLDSLKKDLKWKQSDVIKKRKDDIPNKRKEIDTLNKQISGQTPPSL
jgi:vacuolar-type H+-ATPase subunit H